MRKMVIANKDRFSNSMNEKKITFLPFLSTIFKTFIIFEWF